MYKLESGIVDLLMKHNCVVIPGLGGFIGKKIPAKIDVSHGILLPPSKQFLFNVNLVENDGLLVHYISAKSVVEYFTAEQFISEKVSEWKIDLQQGKPIRIDQLGLIQKKTNGIIEFTQDADSNLLLQSFGLRELHFVPVIPEVDQTQKETTAIKPVKKKRNVWKYAAAACLLPIAFYSFWLPTQTNVFQSKVISIDDFNPFKERIKADYERKDFSYSRDLKNNDDTLELIKSEDNSIVTYVYDENTKIPVRLEKKISSPKKTLKKVKKKYSSIPTPATGNSGRYKVVVGCFAKMDNVERFKARLIQDGFNAVHEKFGTLFRVVIKSTDTKTVANEMVKLSRQKGYKGWILKN